MTFFLLAGRIFVRKSRASLPVELSQYKPVPNSTVIVVKKLRNNGKSIEQEVPIQKLNVGDDIIVPAGAIIPVDGVVIGGSGDH